MVLAVALDLIMLWKSKLSVPGWVGVLLVSAYLASGIYITESTVTNASDYGDVTSIYSEYNRQRLAPGVTPLRPDSVIAGEWNFADLAAITERLRPLRGRFLDNNMLLSDEERRNRFVLDHYLSGIDNPDRLTQQLKEYFFIPTDQFPAYLHTFDDVSRDPNAYADKLKVRYVALPVGQHPPAFLSHGWNLIQPGPYYRIWKRIEISGK
jgi:hypothetical protein